LTSANTKTRSRKYRNGQKNIENEVRKKFRPFSAETAGVMENLGVLLWALWAICFGIVVAAARLCTTPYPQALANAYRFLDA
jgi:hypothetical protein